MAPVADPWDAPYFGAPIYLTYQPTLAERPARAAVAPFTPTDATPTHAPSAGMRWDPWDAPYFGAPVFLAYQPSSLPKPATTAAQPTARGAEPPGERERELVAVGAASPAPTTAPAPGDRRAYSGATPWRQTWFGRLFGGDRRN